MYRLDDFNSLVSSDAFANNGFAFKNLSPKEIIVAVGAGRRIPSHFHLPRQGGEMWTIVEGSCLALRSKVEKWGIGDEEAAILLQTNPLLTNVFDGRYKVEDLQFLELHKGDEFVIPECWLHGCENEGRNPCLIYAVAEKPDDRTFRKIASPFSKNV